MQQVQLVSEGSSRSVDANEVRASVRALARRRMRVDAEFAFAVTNATLNELVDVLAEIAWLKLRYPRSFHARLSLDAVATPSAGQDHYVRAAAAADFFTPERCYTASLDALRALIGAARETDADPDSRRVAEGVLRRLDDLPRRLALAALLEARSQTRRDPAEREQEAVLLESAEAVLGPRRSWLTALKRFGQQGVPRLVVIPTWQCELRCSYCWIPKQDGRVMSPHTLERSIEMLLGSEHDEVMLQFFGGEALIEWGLVQHGIAYAAERAAALGKRVSFIISSNGWSLDEAKLAWLSTFRVKFEFSLDGDPETQNVFRAARDPRDDSYQNGIAPRAAAIIASGIPHEVIMVVHPRNASKVMHNFFHVAGLGFQRIQINFALGVRWTSSQMTAFATGVLEIGEELRRRWSQGERLVFVNLERRPQPILLNGEVTVDWDGTIFGGNAFLHETKNKAKFVVGHLDDCSSFDRYYLDSPHNTYLLEWSYPPDEAQNNNEVGKIFASFVAWMQSGEHTPRLAVPAPSALRSEQSTP
jgi:sulfatase maturation enzyme AslB (radical SAM superfamily)